MKTWIGVSFGSLLLSLTLSCAVSTHRQSAIDLSSNSSAIPTSSSTASKNSLGEKWTGVYEGLEDVFIREEGTWLKDRSIQINISVVDFKGKTGLRVAQKGERGFALDKANPFSFVAEMDDSTTIEGEMEWATGDFKYEYSISRQDSVLVGKVTEYLRQQINGRYFPGNEFVFNIKKK